MEFGKGEEWFVLVGGISEIFHVRAGMSKNPHGGGRTGVFHTAIYSPRRNEQKSTRVMNEDPHVGHSVRRNEQKSTRDEKIGGFHTRNLRSAGLSKKSHDA